MVKIKQSRFRNRCRILDEPALKNRTWYFGSDCVSKAGLDRARISAGPYAMWMSHLRFLVEVSLSFAYFIEVVFWENQLLLKSMTVLCLLFTVFDDHLGKELPLHNYWPTEGLLGSILLQKTWEVLVREGRQVQTCIKNASIHLGMQNPYSHQPTLTAQYMNSSEVILGDSKWSFLAL